MLQTVNRNTLLLTTNQWSKKSINQPFNQSIKPSIPQSINESINQSINQSITQSPNQSIKPTINQLVFNQSYSQPVNHSFKQLINQSTTWAINQLINHSVHHRGDKFLKKLLCYIGGRYHAPMNPKLQHSPGQLTGIWLLSIPRGGIWTLPGWGGKHEAEVSPLFSRINGQ